MNDRARILLLFIFCSALFFLGLQSGVVQITWHELFKYLFHQLVDENIHYILHDLRLPRVLAATLIGASLGGVGLVFQTLLRNPLAEPYTLGLSGGSAFGAVLALYLVLEPAIFWVPCLSTLGCLGATALVIILAKQKMEFESRSLILFGVMISLFFGALVVSGLSILSPEKLQSALLWLLGQFGTTRDLWIYSLWPIFLAGLAILMARAHVLDILALGEVRTLSLGYSPKRERTQLIFIATILTALGVSIAGLVGFIGLVTPHLARRILKTSNHLKLFIGSFFIGGALLNGADIVGRIIVANQEIPAGSVAALFGAPLLIFLLMSQRHAYRD